VKILHVVRGLPNSSGTTQVVKALAEAQARRGASVALWLCEQRGEVPILPDESLVPSRIFATSLPLYHPGISLPFARAVSGAVNKFDFIHIHAVWNFPTWWTMRTADRAGVPFMIAPHGSFEPWAMRRHARRKLLYARYLELPLIDRAWAVHALSPAEVDQVRALGVTAPVEILPNGIDLSPFDCRKLDLSECYAIPPGVRTVLSLSRLDPKKGIDILISGFARFSKVMKDVHLIVAGQDYQSGYARVLVDIVRRNSLDDRVHFIGEIRGSEKYQLLRSVDAFALISHSEGLPLCVLEAMAAGLPVIVTPGCHLEDIEAAGAGLITKTDAGEVAGALEALFRHSEMIVEMGEAGRRIVRERFTWPSIVERTLVLYQQAMDHAA